MKTLSIKSPSQLKSAYYESTPDGHFFDRRTMAFFGDTMANYGTRKCRVSTNWHSSGKYDGNAYNEEPLQFSAIELYRKRPVKHGLHGSAYFHAETGEELGSVEEV
jgi:hypothetical protein